jgi:hypothetical protein
MSSLVTSYTQILLPTGNSNSRLRIAPLTVTNNYSSLTTKLNAVSQHTVWSEPYAFLRERKKKRRYSRTREDVVSIVLIPLTLCLGLQSVALNPDTLYSCESGGLVSIVTRSRAERARKLSSILGRGNRFVFSQKCPNQLRGPPTFLCNRYRELAPRGRCLKMKSPEVSAEVRLGSGTTPSSPVRFYGVQRNKFTSIFLIFFFADFKVFSLCDLSHKLWNRDW